MTITILFFALGICALTAAIFKRKGWRAKGGRSIPAWQGRLSAAIVGMGFLLTSVERTITGRPTPHAHAVADVSLNVVLFVGGLAFSVHSVKWLLTTQRATFNRTVLAMMLTVIAVAAIFTGCIGLWWDFRLYRDFGVSSFR